MEEAIKTLKPGELGDLVEETYRTNPEFREVVRNSLTVRLLRERLERRREREERENVR